MLFYPQKGFLSFLAARVVIAPARNAGASVKESTDMVKWREMIDIDHQPKQLEMIELKLEIDSEKERWSKPKHETMVETSTGMERDRIGARGSAHMLRRQKSGFGGKTLGEF